jgi:hypothetical protein
MGPEFVLERVFDADPVQEQGVGESAQKHVALILGQVSEPDQGGRQLFGIGGDGLA